MSKKIITVDFNDPEQGKDLLFLLNSYAQDPMGGGEPLSDHVQQNLADTLAKTAGAYSFILYWDNKPAGLCNCFTGFSTFACKPLLNIHDLAVLPEYRGMGFGKALLQAAKQKAEQLGCCKVTLEVLSNNNTAIAAYEKFGFKLYQLDEAAGTAEFMELKL
ncbi:GNAT family N-acetyltransferase [Planctobacterium marinum]|uniref:N-acetyltransferase n=1 Tax=Planctobacterium marinum TaxID=1631968 RepID=A0AA48HMM7_9ALTE|nr:N-acetyltransferase [Planctobacterium marinum]